MNYNSTKEQVKSEKKDAHIFISFDCAAVMSVTVSADRGHRKLQLHLPMSTITNMLTTL